MPALPRALLSAKLRAALPPGVLPPGDRADNPQRLDHPTLGRLNVYLWTITPDRSTAGRPIGEHKIQLIVDGQVRGHRGAIQGRADELTIVLGYSPDFGVFVGWDARFYADFAYSRNVQVPEALLEVARARGWAVAAPRRVSGGFEVRVAFSPGNLDSYLLLLRDANERGLESGVREAYFDGAARSPETERDPEAVENVRRRVSASRIQRSARFAPEVKAQYVHMCAACGAQLSVTEAAHIIPVSEPGGLDECWNGICLCPTHHKLFDSRLLLVGEDLVMRIDEGVLQFLEREGRAGGAPELLRAHSGRRIRLPEFWDTNRGFRERMVQALRLRMATTGSE